MDMPPAHYNCRCVIVSNKTLRRRRWRRWWPWLRDAAKQLLVLVAPFLWCVAVDVVFGRGVQWGTDLAIGWIGFLILLSTVRW